jgi:16S rRNA (guanine527-N7)-methyltransferase
MINGPLKGLNLTRITSPDEFKAKQFDDSIIPFNQSKELLNAMESVDVIVDIGFGGGFPILPLAWSYRTKIFLGLEARAKKVEAVKQIAKELKLNNVKLFHQRFEEINFDKKVLIVSKAVDKIENILNGLNLSTNCLVGFYKGRDLNELEKLDATNDELVTDFAYQLLEDHQRRFIMYKCVPRRTNTKKKLVNVSELLLP